MGSKNIYDNIKNMILKETSDDIKFISNEKIKNISLSKETNTGQRRSELVVIPFSVNMLSTNEKVEAAIKFKTVNKDINNNPISVLIYKIYKDEYNTETSLRSENPELIAEISPSMITDSQFSFVDSNFPIGGIAFYSITCVDSSGIESPCNFWQKYEDSYQEMNNIDIVSSEILADKSIKIIFDIVPLKTYVSSIEDIMIQIERDNFYEMLGSCIVEDDSGNIIDSFESLEVVLKPNVFNQEINVYPRTKRGTISDLKKTLMIGSADLVPAPDITYDIGSISSVSASEELYVNSDGGTVSRIKLNFTPGIIHPSNILVKSRRVALPGSPQENFVITYDGEYSDELNIEQGASSGWNKIQTGVDYEVRVYSKTVWGLMRSTHDAESIVRIEGNTVPPTPIYFFDLSSGSGSKTAERYFDLDWCESIDFDDDVTEIRISKTNVTEWDNADYLYRGRARKFNYTPNLEAFGTYQTSGTIRFWVKSINSRGIEQENASYVDYTNNAPSAPDAPVAEIKSIGIIVNITPKNTISDRDIDYYNIYVNENGVDISQPIQSKDLSFVYSPNVDKTYKFKVTSVDIYEQESSFSGFSNSILSNLSINALEIIIYPSGNRSIDTNLFNEAFAYFSSNSGGKIVLLPSTYYLDRTSLSCNSIYSISIVSELGEATLSINGSSNNITVGGGSFHGIKIINELDYTDIYFIGFNDVFNCSDLDGINISLPYNSSSYQSKIRECKNMRNVTADIVEDCENIGGVTSNLLKNCKNAGAVSSINVENCSFENAVNCENVKNSSFNSGKVLKVCENCIFGGISQWYYGPSYSKIGYPAKISGGQWLGMSDIEQVDNAIIEKLNCLVESTVAREITQGAYSTIVNSDIKYGTYDALTNKWDSTALTIMQNAFSNIINSKLVSDIKQPISQTRYSFPFPPPDRSIYLECGSGIFNSTVLKGNVIQSLPDAGHPALRFLNYLSDSSIYGNVTTYDIYNWSNNTITGTITHNT